MYPECSELHERGHGQSTTLDEFIVNNGIKHPYAFPENTVTGGNQLYNLSQETDDGPMAETVIRRGGR